MKVQRLRLRFARDESLKYLPHLDLMRAWERALRRAEVPVAYSEGFSPRPRLALAAPLPVGVTSEGELLDLFLSERTAPAAVAQAVSTQLPVGLRLLGVDEVALALPSLQSALRAAEYVVEVVDPRPLDALRAAIADLLAQDRLEWEHRREQEVRRYDLRALILSLGIDGKSGDRVALRMRLRADEQGSGRPEQVTAALGIAEPPLRVQRVRLEVAEPSIARTAYRTAGRFAD